MNGALKRSDQRHRNVAFAASASDDLPVRVGAEIRSRRKARNMTMEHLAGAAGLSQPFLSQVERGLARLSMRSLDRVAQALDTSAVGLLAARGESGGNLGVSLVRRAQCVQLPMTDHLIDAYGYAVTEGHRHLRSVEFVGGPEEFGGHFFVHRNEEMCFVIDGEFEFEVDGDLYRLGPGDSITYAGGTPHRYRVFDRRTARLLVTIINEDCDVDSGRARKEH